MPPKNTKKNSKEEPKRRRTRKRLVFVDQEERTPLDIVASTLTERHPLNVDETTPNPVVNALLGTTTEQPTLSLSEKQRRAPNLTRWNEKTGQYEKLKKTAKVQILGCDYNYEPTEEDGPRLMELNKLKIDELKEILFVLREGSTEGGVSAGARRHHEFVNLILCLENKKRKPASPEKLPSPLGKEQEETPEESTESVEFSEKELQLVSEKEAPTIPYNFSEPESLPRVSEEVEIIPPNLDIPQEGSPQYNLFLAEQEKKEFLENQSAADPTPFLYPTLNDPNFNVKIASRKEFQDTQYDGTIYDIKKQSELLCSADFELMPHQLFVKNFLSFQTPYNALLLYHGLGSGKTSSAIGIAEEMRSYMRQVGFHQRILVVASPNVQRNFELQLFDDRNLKLEDGVWRMNTPMGNDLLQEINPTQLKGIPREKVISQIRRLISQYYTFMGYRELSNFITKKITVEDETKYTRAQFEKRKARKIQAIFNNRLLIIDEVHNIRISDDNKERKKTAALLMEVVKHAENMRLLMLSATPMFNNYTEIIWLVNLMNMLDKRSTIRESDVFDKEGNFLPERTLPNGAIMESGRDLLQRKLTGYVSYVRGENPFTFPYRVYPAVFSPENTFQGTDRSYPTLQMNRRPIESPLKYVPVYLSSTGPYQQRAYNFLMETMRKKSFSTQTLYGEERMLPSFENMESFGYMYLQQPLEALNITYPSSKLDRVLEGPLPEEEDSEVVKQMTGKTGLATIFTSKTEVSPYPMRYNFEYRPEVLENYGSIFKPELLGNYSGKISKICSSIFESTGIVLVYSEYIDGGVVPVALALEEMGFTRYGSANYTKPLFKKPPTEAVDSVTMLPHSEFSIQYPGKEFKPAKYVMITGDKSFSPNNLEDIKYVTNRENKNGENVKVILISKAGAEGLDFKNIRQVHILEPWYNMNRMEQIIGRGVRNLSHCQLPFEKRNVEIYLHGSLPIQENEEPADLYVYRFAEKKAVQIGKITRLLKETAVDCILNIGQTNLTVDELAKRIENQNLEIELSSKKTKIPFRVGDKPFTEICDYMDNCSFKCRPDAPQQFNVIYDTYTSDFVNINYSRIAKRIRQVFKEQPVIDKEHLVKSINILKKYPEEHIEYALSNFIDSKNELLYDKYGRAGHLVNKDQYYAFQPLEITDDAASVFERSVPIEYKHDRLEIELPSEKVKPESLPTTEEGIPSTSSDYDALLKSMKENLQHALVKTPLETKEKDWFKHAGHVLQLLQEQQGIPLETLTKYIIWHNLDTLTVPEKMILLRKFYTHDTPTAENEFENHIVAYFNEKVMVSTSTKGILLANANYSNFILYLQDPANKTEWREAQDTDYDDFLNQMREKYVIHPNRRAAIIGFMHPFEKDNIVFKSKVVGEGGNNKGVVCWKVGKAKTILRFNDVLGKTMYDTKNTKHILADGICIMMEMAMRYMTEKDSANGNLGKVAFMDLEKTLVNQLISV
jgi:Helicase conserved C-terminal domain